MSHNEDVGSNKWSLGARPKTLPASIVPIIVGTAIAFYDDRANWVIAALCLVVALSFQVGVNYANDYSDGVRGTDANRVGPLRLTASGLASPQAVRTAAACALGVGCLAGLIISLLTFPLLILIGLASVVAAVTYTAGPRPYGYHGLGEVIVFVFFGLVATVGTYFVQAEQVTSLAVLGAITMGCWSVAMLLANNLRDLPTDAVAGKKTLVVRVGDARARWLYAAAVLTPFAGVLLIAVQLPIALFVLIVLLPAMQSVGRVRTGASGNALIWVLGHTGKCQMAFGLLLASACVLSSIR